VKEYIAVFEFILKLLTKTGHITYTFYLNILHSSAGHEVRNITVLILTTVA
jgi:hypothetical protein